MKNRYTVITDCGDSEAGYVDIADYNTLTEARQAVSTPASMYLDGFDMVGDPSEYKIRDNITNEVIE